MSDRASLITQMEAQQAARIATSR